MSNEQDNDKSNDVVEKGSPRTRRTAWIVGLAVAAVAVVAIVVSIALLPKGSTTASSTSTPSTSASSEATPSASASDVKPGETASASPSVDPGNPFPELDPVEPTDTGSADGLSVELTNFESVTGEVVGPGDVAAAAVRVTIDITNTGSAAMNLNLVVMNAYMGEQRDPAEPYEQPGGKPVNGSLEPGKTAQGVYVFRIPEDRRADVTFVVDYQAGQPAITWRGQVP